MIVLGRSQGVVEFPARIQLVLTANPCPCARPAGDLACECSPVARRRYLGRISGPLLDRIDLQVQLDPISAGRLADAGKQETSHQVAERVAKAHAVAEARWRPLNRTSNADVPGRILREPPWRLPREVTNDLRRHLDRGILSARGYDRVLRLGWTLADLAGLDRPGRDELSIAITLRSGRR